MTHHDSRTGPRLWAAYPWLVAAAAAVALAAALAGAGLPPARGIVLLCAAGVLASLVRVPMPAGGHQSLRAAVAAAGLDLFGAPVAAVAMIAGTVLGDGLPRRRALPVVLFNAGQLALATLAAGGAAELVHPGALTWSGGEAVGRQAAEYALGFLAAAVVFAAVSFALVSGYLSAARRRTLLEVMSANAGSEIVVTLLLFVVGATTGLVIRGVLPIPALSVAAPAAIAVVALLASAARRQASGDLLALHEAVLDVNRTRSAGEIVHALAAAMDRLAPSEFSAVWLRMPGEAAPGPVLHKGLAAGGSAVCDELTDLVNQAMRSGRPIRVGDHERGRRHVPHDGCPFGAGGALSVMVVPMATAGEVWGALALAENTRNHFSGQQERMLVTLAGSAALAMRNAHLAEESHDKDERLTALRFMGFAPGEIGDLDETCRAVVRRSAEALGARYALLVLCDGHSGLLRGQAAFGTDEEEFRRLRTDPDAEPELLREAARSLRERRPFACAMVADPHIPACRCPVLLALPEACYALTAPMFHRSQPVGALTVVRSEPSPFTDPETAVLEATAAQGAVAIENARAYAALQARSRHLHSVLEMSARIYGAADLAGVFALVAEGARDLFGATGAALVVWDGRGPVKETLGSGLSDECMRTVIARVRNGRSRYTGLAPRPHVVTDLASGPDGKNGRSGVFLPLRSDSTLHGLLALLYDDEAGGVPSDLTMPAVLADQVAFSVARIALLAGSERRLGELALLNRIIGSVNTSLDPGEVCRIAISELAEAAGFARVTVHRLEGARLRLLAHVGCPDAPAETPVSSGIRGRVARTGRPEFVSSASDDPDYVASSPEVTSMAVVPVVLEGVTTGVLAVEGTGARPLAPHSCEFLTEFAEQVSIAVRNASLFEDLRRTHDELQVLFEAAKAVSGTLDLRTVLDSLVSVTCRAFGYENGALLMVDSTTGDLIVEAAYGYNRPVVGVRVPAGAGISGWVARSGSPLIVDDVRRDSRYMEVDDRTCSEMAVPLIAEGKVLGVFNVESTRPAAFGQRDLRLLGALASYAIVAIQNARLYEQAQRLAITDGLTELFNHRYFYEALDRLLERSRRDAVPLSIIMAEIDHFKKHNDTYGHRSGDEVLRTVAGLLRRGSRPSDVVARYGGDEFMVVLPGVGKAAAHETAERLRRTVEAYPFAGNGDGAPSIASVTMSMGVAAYPQDGATTSALVEAADRSQYAAKRSGGNRVHSASAQEG